MTDEELEEFLGIGASPVAKPAPMPGMSYDNFRRNAANIPVDPAQQIQALEAERLRAEQAEKDRIARDPRFTGVRGRLKSAGLGAIQGMSGNFSDEITAGFDTALSKVPGLRDVASASRGFFNLGGRTDVNNPALTYAQRRDREREMFDTAQAANPKSFVAGSVGGGLVSPINKLGPVGAGAIGGAGASTAETLEGVALDAGVGAVIGKGLSAAGQAVGAGVKKVAEKLAPAATRATLKAVGEGAEKAVRDRISLTSNERVMNVIKNDPNLRSVLGNAEKISRAAGEGASTNRNLALSLYDAADKASKTNGIPVSDVMSKLEVFKNGLIKQSKDKKQVALVQRFIDELREGLGRDPKVPIPAKDLRAWVSERLNPNLYSDEIEKQVINPTAADLIKKTLHPYVEKSLNADAVKKLAEADANTHAYVLIKDAAEKRLATQLTASGPLNMPRFVRNLSAPGVAGAAGGWRAGKALGGPAGLLLGGPSGAAIGEVAGPAIGAGAGYALGRAAEKSGRQLIANVAVPTGRDAIAKSVASGVAAGATQPTVDDAVRAMPKIDPKFKPIFDAFISGDDKAQTASLVEGIYGP